MREQRSQASWAVWIGLMSAVLTVSCATPRRAGPAGLCVAQAASPAALEKNPQAWFTLLLHGYDASPRFLTRPLIDCSGTPVLWASEGESCEELGRYGEPLPSQPLTAEDLVLVSVAPQRWVAWVIARRFSTGEGMGPVAVVDWVDQTLVVRSLGTLRAQTGQVRLQLAKAGSTELLVAEGAYCPPGAGAKCERAALLMPRRGNRFIAEPLTDTRGACVGPAVLHLARSQTQRLDSGWDRRFEMNTSLEFSPSGITALEQMVVSDLDPKQPSVPPRIFRRAQAERFIQVQSQGLVTQEPSLWSRVAEASQR